MNNFRLFLGIALSGSVADRLAQLAERLADRLPYRAWTHPADYHITLHFLGDTPPERVEAVQAAARTAAAGAAPFPLTLGTADTFGPPAAPRVLWCGVTSPTPPLAPADCAAPHTPAALAAPKPTTLAAPYTPAALAAPHPPLGPADCAAPHTPLAPADCATPCTPHAPAALAALHAALAPPLAASGFALEARPYRAHITLARRGGPGSGPEAVSAAWQAAVQALAPLPADALSWTAASITLFRTHLGRRPAYERLAEFPFAPHQP